MKRHWPLVVVLVLVLTLGRRAATLQELQASHGQLIAGQASLAKLPAVPTATDPTAATMSAAELKALRDAAFRVHQLRGEVTLAQQRIDNLAPIITNLAARVHARTNLIAAAITPEFPPGYLPRHELADRGNATPEAALETFWWAMSHGNLPKLFAVSMEMAGQSVPENPNREDDFTQLFRNFPGYQVVKRENGPAGKLVMGLRTAPDARVVDLILVHTNGQWLVSVESLQKVFEDSSR